MSTKKLTKKQKKQRKFRITFLIFAIFIFTTFLISTVFSDWVKIIDNKKQTKNLTVYYDNLLEEQASLNSEVVKLQDPEYVARYAREKYLYTKDGETILKIVDGQIIDNSNNNSSKDNNENEDTN